MHIVRTIVCFTLAILSFALRAQDFDLITQNKITAEFFEAEKLYEKGEYFETLSHFSRINELSKGVILPTAKVLEIKALVQLGRFDIAERELEKLFSIELSREVLSELSGINKKIELRSRCTGTPVSSAEQTACKASCEAGIPFHCWLVANSTYPMGMGCSENMLVDARTTEKYAQKACDGGIDVGCGTLLSIKERCGSEPPRTIFDQADRYCREGVADACGFLASKVKSRFGRFYSLFSESERSRLSSHYESRSKQLREASAMESKARSEAINEMYGTDP